MIGCTDYLSQSIAMNTSSASANTTIEVNIMQNYANGPEMPLGFGMALVQNIKAMNYFAELSAAEQQAIIQGTHKIQSKEEMQDYVQSLVK